MALWFYHHSGLRVASELHLPEWSAFEEAAPHAAPDLKIRWSNAPLPDTEDEAPPVAAGEYRFFVSNAAEYRVSRTGEIEVRAVLRPDMSKVRVFLLGAAWAAFCYLHDLLLLHASVVAVGDGAVAFCGPSGAGKSSLAARLTTLGHPLVSDDLCRLDLSGPGPALVYPSSTRLKLWREALSNLEITGGALERDHARMDKYHVPLVGVFPPDRLPLMAICVLAWGDPAFTRLTGTAALRRLVGAATYRGDLLEAIGGLAGHWSLCAELARRVPLWELRRPQDWSQMDATVAQALMGAALM